MSESAAMANRKFYRLYAHFEVELTDETKLRERGHLRPAKDDQGDLTGVIDLPIGERVQFAVNDVISRALSDAEAETGLRWVMGSVMEWPLAEDGETYEPLTLPSLPQRRDDGTIPGIDS